MEWPIPSENRSILWVITKEPCLEKEAEKMNTKRHYQEIIDELTKTHRGKGIILTILSAILFGLSPLLTSYIYQMGGNPETVTFYRSLFACLVLFAVLVQKRISISLPLSTIRNLMIVGVFGGALTTLLLYGSYLYVGIGTATTLHFVYPAFVGLICRIFFKEELGLRKIIVLVISSIGILCFFEIGQIRNMTGVLLAIASGITYALYMVGIEKMGLGFLNAYLATFYVGIAVILFMLLYNIPTQKIVFSLSPIAYLSLFILAMMSSFFAVMFLQLGIKYLGATTAAIFCLFEPITSIVAGGIFLGESLTVMNILGCLLIFLSVILLTLDKKNTGKSESR